MFPSDNVDYSNLVVLILLMNLSYLWITYPLSPVDNSPGLGSGVTSIAS